MTLSIRLATADDVAELVALEHRCFTGDRIGKASFRRFTQVSSAKLWIVQSSDMQDKIAGYAITLTRRNSNWWRVYSIATAPEARGTGVGKFLMNHIITACRKAKAAGVSLEVKDSNMGAITLYRALGFEVTDLLAQYYEDGSDGYRMRLSLPPTLIS